MQALGFRNACLFQQPWPLLATFSRSQGFEAVLNGDIVQVSLPGIDLSLCPSVARW